MRTIGKLGLALVALVLVGAQAREAKADVYGAYVCNVYYVPGSSAQGTDGYAVFNLMTGTACGGTTAGNGFYYACSSGATYSKCPSDPLNRYNAASLLGIFQALKSSVDLYTRVDVFERTCNDGTTRCLGPIRFRSD